MVKAGLSESVVIQKIRTSQRKFDTSKDGLIALKNAGVPDKVIEAMISPGTPVITSDSRSTADPWIAHVGSGPAKPLKVARGQFESTGGPFESRQEIVLLEARAEYRITDKLPMFSTNLSAEHWILIRLKPGRRDRNLPINKSGGGGWGYWGTVGGVVIRRGPDPKYVVTLAAEPSPDGGFRIRPKEELSPGEYGFVAVYRGEPIMTEVFEFGLD